MSARRVIVKHVALLALLAIPRAHAAPKGDHAPDLTLHPSLTPQGTRCILCHTVKGWDDVRFDHERTGFPLVGVHKKITCRQCHASDFKKPLPDRCAGCHRDPHAQEFGQQCEGCHDAQGWQTQFNADAHRAGNFPLTGRHAFIPCTECHPQARDRSFARGVVQCAGCHLADYQRTAMLSIDHGAAGFSTLCQQCHTAWSFSPARFPQHDLCFSLSSGPHTSIACRTCHTSLVGATVNGMCATNTAACTHCHTHDQASTDSHHARVKCSAANASCNPPGATTCMVCGYQYADRKCYECHRFATVH